MLHGTKCSGWLFLWRSVRDGIVIDTVQRWRVCSLIEGHCVFPVLLFFVLRLLSPEPYFFTHHSFTFSFPFLPLNLTSLSFPPVLYTHSLSLSYQPPKYFPAVTLVTYSVELRIVYKRDAERKRGAGTAQNNALPAVFITATIFLYPISR